MASSTDILLAGGLPFIEIRGNQAVFGGPNSDSDMRWGPDSGNRKIEGSEFVIDKHYWELLGCPLYSMWGWRMKLVGKNICRCLTNL